MTLIARGSHLEAIQKNGLKIDAIVGAVAELGKLTQNPTPHIDAIYASVKLPEATKIRILQSLITTFQ